MLRWTLLTLSGWHHIITYNSCTIWATESAEPCRISSNTLPGHHQRHSRACADPSARARRDRRKPQSRCKLVHCSFCCQASSSRHFSEACTKHGWRRCCADCPPGYHLFLLKVWCSALRASLSLAPSRSCKICLMLSLALAGQIFCGRAPGPDPAWACDLSSPD